MLFGTRKSAKTNSVGVAGWLGHAEERQRLIPGADQEHRLGSSDPWSHLGEPPALQSPVTVLQRHPAHWRAA